jgi:myo-inositol-1(or 4)-monophosphatase
MNKRSNQNTWGKELLVATQAAREAGRLLRHKFGRVEHVMKKGKIDLVTEADFQSEKIILDIIGSRFPQDEALTEETGIHKKGANRKWIVDPLDGTVNFAHAFPFFCVSIALEVQKEVILGVVYDPLLDELFEAVQGGGAFLNERPIRVSEVQDLKESLLGTGFPYDIHDNPHQAMDFFRKMVVTAQGIRRPGSAAMDICYVAAGRLDGFWEKGLKPWDTAAGTLIAREAGGRLSTFGGGPYTPYKQSIVASNALIHEPMLSVLKENG